VRRPESGGEADEKDNAPLDQRDRRAAERPPEHDLESRHRHHQRFVQKTVLAVRDDLDAAEYGGEQDAHRDNARRQELHVVAAARSGEARAAPPERQQEQDRLAERADHAGARTRIPLQLPQPQNENGVHRRPRHT
jgi:hypothetical protein